MRPVMAISANPFAQSCFDSSMRSGRGGLQTNFWSHFDFFGSLHICLDSYFITTEPSLAPPIFSRSTEQDYERFCRGALAATEGRRGEMSPDLQRRDESHDGRVSPELWLSEARFGSRGPSERNDPRRKKTGPMGTESRAPGPAS